MYWNIVKTKNSALSLNLFLTLAHTSQFFQIVLRQVLQIYHKLYDGKNNREDTFTNLKATQLCVPNSQSALGPSGNSSQDLSFREEVCAQQQVGKYQVSYLTNKEVKSMLMFSYSLPRSYQNNLKKLSYQKIRSSNLVIQRNNRQWRPLLRSVLYRMCHLPHKSVIHINRRWFNELC